jgi:hypothetical protein
MGSTGVRDARSPSQLAFILDNYVAQGYFENRGELLVRKKIRGSLFMVCGVFSYGRLKAWHACVRVRGGVGGGACKKVSLPLPILGDHLQGHGFQCISMEH